DLIARLTSTEEGKRVLNEERSRYVNVAVSDAVKKLDVPERIVEYDGRLVQRIYPIYLDKVRPRHWLDYSANLYQPIKHFMGHTFDTLYFNIAVIWLMTAVLFITLYADLLKRIMKAFYGKDRRHKRKE